MPSGAAGKRRSALDSLKSAIGAGDDNYSTVGEMQSKWNSGTAAESVTPLKKKKNKRLTDLLSGASDIAHGYLPGQRPKK